MLCHFDNLILKHSLSTAPFPKTTATAATTAHGHDHDHFSWLKIGLNGGLLTVLILELVGILDILDVLDVRPLAVARDQDFRSKIISFR